MRKFLLNGGVLAAVGSGIGLIRSTRTAPHDWRLALLWVGWLLTVAIAIGTVMKDSEELRLET